MKASAWSCPNESCELHGKRQHLGPGNRLTTWTCRKCATVLEAADL